MIKNGKQIIWHIAGILSFLVVPVLLSPHPSNEIDFLISLPAIRDFTANAFMILFFYFNYYALIPDLYLKKKYFLYAIILILALAVIVYVPSILTGHDPWLHNFREIPPQSHYIPASKPMETGYLTMIGHHILLFIIVVLFSILVKTRNQLYQESKARSDAEIYSLKSWINPHFLFNTLNSIYALAIRDHSMATASGIMKLSGMMRYITTNTHVDTVPLEKEINYIRDYIALQKMRLDDQVNLTFEVSESDKNLKIAPLILIAFIENAFKYGVNPDEDCQIVIKVSTSPDQVHLYVQNNIVITSVNTYEKSGLGLQKTTSRLDIMYPDKHKLNIEIKDNLFCVDLIIDLK